MIRAWEVKEEKIAAVSGLVKTGYHKFHVTASINLCGYS